MFITLSNISGTSLYIIPIVPPDVSFKLGGDNQTLQTVKGNIRLVGEKTLKNVSWSSIFPVRKNYSFTALGSRNNGYDYVNFLEDALTAKVPIRIIEYVRPYDNNGVITSYLVTFSASQNIEL